MGEIASIRIGRTPPRNEPAYWTSDLERPFCSIADMTDATVTPTREGVTALAEEKGKAKRVPVGSLLLSFKLTIGRVGYAGIDLFPNEAIAWVEPTTPDIDRHYLGLWLGHQDLTAGSGRAVKGETLNTQSLRAICVDLPPVPEQRRIVDLVATIDRSRTGDRIRAASDAVAAGLMRDLEVEATSWARLGDVVTKAKAGATPSRAESRYWNGSIPWLKSGEVDADRIASTTEAISEAGFAASSTWLMPIGTIVIAMYGQGLTAGSVGFTAAPMCTNQAVLGLVADERLVSSRFLFHWLRSRKDSMRERRTGSTQPNLSKDLVLQERVPLISVQRQVQLAALLDQLARTAVAATKQDRVLRRLREVLATDLLSGDHEIPASYDRFIDGVQ